MSLPTHHMRIAVLVNTSPSSPIEPFVRASWKRALRAVEQTAEVDFYDPIIAQEYPQPQLYDLIVLSGGSADPRSSEPWVLKMMDFIRDVAALPRAKLLGICWGHQAIAQALGGKVETMETGPVADISSIQLTPEGRAFLGCPMSRTSFLAPEFHVRQVSEPGPNFIPLAEGHQAYLAERGNIFSFQTHLEMDSATVQAILENTNIYTSAKTKMELDDIMKRAIDGHDGHCVLSKIVQWVYDHN